MLSEPLSVVKSLLIILNCSALLMEVVPEGDRVMATFVTEEHAVISAGMGQKPLGRHKRYSEQQKNYPGKTRSCDISILQTYKGIYHAISSLRTVI